MKFIKKKNMQASEELLYTPQLHWFFIVRHIVRSLPFFLALLTVLIIESSFMPVAFLEEYTQYTNYVFLAALAVVLVLLAWSVFQYLCTEYGVTNKRLVMKKGVFRVSTAEIPTDRIESIYCEQGICGRIFNFGTVFISGIGGRLPVFYMVARPYALRRKIIDIVEKNKTITVVHGEIPKAPPPPKPEPKRAKEEPVYRYGTFVRVLPEN